PGGAMPTIAFHSFTPASDEVSDATYGQKIAPDVYIPELKAGHNPKELYSGDLVLNFENDAVAFQAAVSKSTENGATVFKGEIVKGELKIPARIAIGGKMIYGRKDFDYF